MKIVSCYDVRANLYFSPHVILIKDDLKNADQIRCPTNYLAQALILFIILKMSFKN